VGDAVLRLLRIEIEQFRSLEDQYIPAEGLVVLFGANSVGKTSLLEAVENLIAEAGSFRPDPGVEEDPFVLGSVIFDLPAANVADSEDARLYLAFLRGDYSKPGILGGPPQYPWGWLDEERRASLKDADLKQAKAMLTDALARAGDAGSAEDRELLSKSVFDPAAAYFVADTTHTERIPGAGIGHAGLGTMARFQRLCLRAGQLYLAGHRLSWTVNPSFLSTATAPLFPPSKSPEARCWPVANS
jgi:hypothetical protein